MTTEPDWMAPAEAFLSLPRTADQLARRFRDAYETGKMIARQEDAPDWAKLRAENTRLRAGLEEIVGLASAHFGACLFCSKAHGPQKPDMGTCPIGRALYALVPTPSESDPKEG
jgi:hypothetical protein